MTTIPTRLDAGQVELRAWRPEDADHHFAAIAASFPELHRWMPWAQSMPTREELREVLAEGARAFAAGEDHPYAMWDLVTGEVVGSTGLHRRLGEGAIEIGYWVRTDRHGRGYATAAAGALTDAAFEPLHDVERVQVRMDAANVASARVPAKLGYRLLGQVERDISTPGHTGSGLVWETDRRSWLRPRVVAERSP